MKNSKQRRKSETLPYIYSIDSFIRWCDEKGIEYRRHPDVLRTGYLIKVAHPDWMAILYNKSLDRYTCDPRLTETINKYYEEIGKDLIFL